MAVAAQHKGWSYRFYPVNASAVLLAAHTLAAALTAGALHRHTRLPRRVVTGVCAALLLLFISTIIALAVQRAVGPIPEKLRVELAMRAAVRRQSDAASMFVLSSQQRDGAPLALGTGLDWRPGYPALWVPLVRYRSYAGPSTQEQYRSPAHMSEGERWAFNRVVRDFVTQTPDLLVVESRELNARRTRFPGGFDFLAYYGKDSAFARLFARYEPVERVDGFSLMRRRAPPTSSP